MVGVIPGFLSQGESFFTERCHGSFLSGAQAVLGVLQGVLVGEVDIGVGCGCEAGVLAGEGG